MPRQRTDTQGAGRENTQEKSRLKKKKRREERMKGTYLGQETRQLYTNIVKSKIYRKKEKSTKVKGR